MGDSQTANSLPHNNMSSNPPGQAGPTVPPVLDPATAATVNDEVLRARVRALVPAEPAAGGFTKFVSKLFSHTFLLLLAGFLLTGVVGAGLSERFQDKADQRRRAAEIRETRRSAAEKVFRDVASGLDRRLYLTRRYGLARSSHVEPGVLKAYQAQMDSSAMEWNIGVNTNAALICMYFGPRLASFFSEEVAPNLQKYSELLKHPDPTVTEAQVELQYRRLANAAYALEMRLGDLIRSGSVVQDTVGARCTKTAGLDQALPVLKGTGGAVTFDRL